MQIKLHQKVIKNHNQKACNTQQHAMLYQVMSNCNQYFLYYRLNHNMFSTVIKNKFFWLFHKYMDQIFSKIKYYFFHVMILGN